jgi:hypothetical protein
MSIYESKSDNIWRERRPSRLKVLGVYSKRFLRWRKNSSPFLSGDLFADQSDVSMYPPTFRARKFSLKDLREARVIFCPSSKLDVFLEEHLRNITARVIIAGNDDLDFHEIPKNIPRSVKQLFLQNSFISDHPLVTTLPIGIENYRWGVNGNPRFITAGPLWQTRRHQVLIGPFGLSHPDRFHVRQEFDNDDPHTVFIKNRISPQDFNELMNEFKYVASVRGNGVDTHRFWEALYRGAIPIVVEDDWSRSLKDLGIPICFIDSWSRSNVNQVVSKQLKFQFRPDSLEALWWPFWKRKIEKFL